MDINTLLTRIALAIGFFVLAGGELNFNKSEKIENKDT
jgi:hypothetical protein